MKNGLHDFNIIIKKALLNLYKIENLKINILYTNKEIDGDITLILFNLSKQLKKSYYILSQEIGEYLKNNTNIIKSFNVINGFLNFILYDSYYIELFNNIFFNINYFKKKRTSTNSSIMIEFASPNTNKPLHIGHIRNILLGNAIASLFKYIGRKVIKIQIFNDRGIHICKSMVAWQKFANGKTPNDLKMKGDHFVGYYYISFNQELEKEIKALEAIGYNKKEAENHASIMQDARIMLKKWETRDPKIINLWKKMNTWVYEGFKKTYNRLGIKFDIEEYESDTYLLGKKIVNNGLKQKIFYKKEDGSIWVDLTDEGLDKKLLLRADGTSVYITQDLGTVIQRFQKYTIDSLIYVVGKEQEHHFQVLYSILKKIKFPWINKIYHLAYAMVNLPEGKMNSRKGYVIHADDIMNKMYNIVYNLTKERLAKNERFKYDKNFYEIIGQGALKYHILKIDHTKSITFDYNSSIDFKGQTGTYIQYTYSRICSIQRKSKLILSKISKDITINKYERSLIQKFEVYHENINNAVINLNPALLANYIFELAKNFNDFYQNVNILNYDNVIQSNFRCSLSIFTGKILNQGMQILGINMPKKM